MAFLFFGAQLAAAVIILKRLGLDRRMAHFGPGRMSVVGLTLFPAVALVIVIGEALPGGAWDHLATLPLVVDLAVMVLLPWPGGIVP